jgi:hypothetical protein
MRDIMRVLSFATFIKTTCSVRRNRRNEHITLREDELMKE